MQMLESLRITDIGGRARRFRLDKGFTTLALVPEVECEGVAPQELLM